MNDEQSMTIEDTLHARRGWEILRHVIRPAWMEQPAGDFEVFRDHKAGPISYNVTTDAPYEYDKNAQHLGAMSSVKLGIGSPIYRERPTFEDVAGLWHVEVERGPQTRYDAILPPIVRRTDTWVYTPLASCLVKLGFIVRPLEAYTFAEQHRVLEPFYQHMKMLRDGARSPADLAPVKLIYQITPGTLAHRPPEGSAPGKYLYRPDWWYSLVAQARAIMHYQIFKVWEQEQQAPVMVKTDCIGYAQPVTGLPMGAGIGQFKPEAGHDARGE